MSGSIKIVSYNIHKGLSLLGTRKVLGEIRSAVSEIKADIVLFQEVMGSPSGERQTSQFEFLADQLWQNYSYGKNAVYQSGHHGNAIFSKFPILDQMNIDISNHLLERRGLLYAKIEILPSKRPLHLVCLHLDLSGWGRARQIRRVIDWVHLKVPKDEALIVGGDFNDWRQQLDRPLEKELGLNEAFLVKDGSHAATFPSFFPLLKMDRLYFRGFTVKSVRTLSSQPWTRLSDHLAICSELIWRD